MRVGPVAAAAGILGAAVAGLGYAMVEAHAFTLRRRTVPVLPPGATPLTLLHVSDLHASPGQRRKLRWVRALAELDPDLVISTGDNLSAADAVPAVLDAYRDLLDRPGAFVFGSNDYFGPRRKNPALYLVRRRGSRHVHGEPLPAEDLAVGFRKAGWLDLRNARGILDVQGTRIEIIGVDDPHIKADRYARVSGPADPAAVLTIGVTHAPYLRVLDAMSGDGARLLLAGHTHGGQLCLPLFGTLVTNCDLPRQHARGLSRWAAPGGQETWLHVSAGVGTSPYAPVRFSCRPEATLLTLTPQDT
jgi:uncharacterized protein